MKLVIVVSNEFPPIPVRIWDWCAFPDGCEESGPYGYGRDQWEAIRDMIDALEEADE